jgi:hypothetical membrane protein
MTARRYGVIGIVGVAGWVLANLLLHVLAPELSVVDTVMSEYALGDYGWLSRAGDIANAVGVIAIALGLRATLSPGKRVTASWVLMLVSGVGFFASGVFATDEMEATEVTVSGGIHILSFLVTVISLLIAAWMLRGVFERDDGWRHFQQAQHWFAVAISITFVGNIALGGTAPGLAQRVLAVVLASWWLALAGNVLRVPEVRSDREPIAAA